MNGCKGNYMYWPTETEKKDRKTCRCFPPFVKFHHRDCPAATKPCPVHGNPFHHRRKQQKVDREQNVIISFHPSAKTEKLLHPITSLLAQCNSQTKINFQYYSPENVHSKDGLNQQNGQIAQESLKRSLNSNVLVERTKSFVANKTSKVKKLKQCFHSPCNSIVQKTRSQTSIKEKLNHILREETKKTRNVFSNMVSEIPPDEKKHDPTSKWLNAKKESLKCHDLLSDGDSDFITVTQRDKTDTIHHKIFEIKHRKGLNDLPFAGFPKQHLVYSSVNVTGRPVEVKKDFTRDSLSLEKSVRRESKEIQQSGSEKTNRSVASSSSGSLYITPFIFVPRGMVDSDIDVKPKVEQVEEGVQAEDDSDIDVKPKVEQVEEGVQAEGFRLDDSDIDMKPKVKQVDEGVQAEGFLWGDSDIDLKPEIEQVEEGVQAEGFLWGDSDIDVKPKVKQVEEGVQAEDQQPIVSPKETQTSLSNKRSLEQPTKNSVLLQTDSFLNEQRICHCSRHVYDRENESATRVDQIYLASKDRLIITRNYDDESSRQSRPSEISRSADSTQHTKTAEMQTCSGPTCVRTPDSGGYRRTLENRSSTVTPRKEVPIQSRWDSRTTDKSTQTDDVHFLQVDAQTMTDNYVAFPSQEHKVNTFDSGTNTSQVSEAPWLRFSNKGTQTSFDHDDLNESEFIQLNSPEVTYVIKPFEQQESDQAVDKLAKTKWGKSYSDSELLERVKCACFKLYPDNPYLQPNFSKNSSMNNTPVKSTITKVYESTGVDSRSRNSPPGANVTLRTKETVERFPDAKQTSTREEEFSAAVSDLSELKKIIQEFFEKGNLDSKRTCECLTKEEKVDAQTMTDNFVASPSQEHKKNFTDNGIQTVNEAQEKNNAAVQTLEYTEKVPVLREPKKAEKNDTEAETKVKESQEEAAQEKADNQTAVKSKQSKPYFVCAICGRNMKNFKDATTNTSAFPERPNLVPIGTEYTESLGVKIITKGVQNTDNPKAVVTSEKTEGSRKTLKQPEDSPRSDMAQKSRIPIPNHSTSIRFKNNETVLQSTTYFPAPNLSPPGHPASPASQGPFPVSECICDAFEKPSTSKGQAQTLSNEKPAKPTTKFDSPRKENADGNKYKKNNPKAYPVWVTNFWPKELLNTWNSVEGALSDIPSSDDSKSQTAKPKRSHCKDLEAGAGKKTKAHGKNLFQEFPPELSQLLRQICSSKFTSPPFKDEKNSTDEETVKKLAPATSLEMNDDFLLDSKHFYDSSNTESSFFGDEEDEEDTALEETTAAEPRTKRNGSSTQALKLKPQSHSAVTFKKSIPPKGTSTSKSLNAFLIFINPKKHKTPRRKYTK